MKHILFSILLMVALAAVGQDTLSWQRCACLRLDSVLLDPALRTSQMAFMVYDLTDSVLLYASHPKTRMRPASTEKLLTAISALSELGPAYAYTTRLCRAGDDVYVVGGMDPMLSAADLREMADSLRTAGLDTIRGRLLLDRSFYTGPEKGWGWCWDDKYPSLTALFFGGKNTFAPNLLQTWRGKGITIKGEPKAGVCPAGAATLCTIRRPLVEVLRPMMKESNNIYAESLFHQAGSREKAAARIERRIRALGLDPQDYIIGDGSGLSPYNHLTPELLVAFLRFAYYDDALRPVVLDALPTAGIDGTMKNRLALTSLKGRVHAKTGTLTAVSSLAGYLEGPEGHTLAFAILNQGIRRAKEGHRLQERILLSFAPRGN